MTVEQLPRGATPEPDVIWRGMPSRFRNFVSTTSPHFPPERDRYVLYYNPCCPWAHRTIIAHSLKGLSDIVQLIEVDARDPVQGWWFSGWRGPDRCPIYGIRYIKELYLKADPKYNGRVTVPLLWDKKNQTIVNNESSEILRMFLESFDEFLAPEQREANKGAAAYLPSHLRAEIDEMNAWVYDTVNNGVYKAGFASSQHAYDEHVRKLFESLDRLESHLDDPRHQPYLFGAYITEADIRLFTTLIRFDVAYYTLFKCNLKMIRVDYPRLHAWLRRLYWSEGPETAGGAFKQTTLFEAIRRGYSTVSAGNGIIPIGPRPYILPL